MTTTITWLLIYVGSCVMSFVNPLWGVFGYIFEYYLRPSLHWWGQPLPNLRWNLTISLVLLASFLVRRQSLPACRPVRDPVTKWLLGLVLVMIIITPFAASWERSYDKLVMFAKYVAIYILIVQVVRTRRGFDTIVALHMAGAAWWGWEQYLDPKRTAGRLAHVGSSDTQGDNQAAAHLLTVLPFIFVYLLRSKDKRLRALALVAAPLVLNLFILCNSRGSTIGLGAGVLAAFFLARRGHRLRLVLATAAIGALFWNLADPEYKARQKTTADYETESTALERLESWQGGWRLIKENPLGTGGEGYEVLSPVYISEIVAAHGGELRAPHNTWVLVTSEWGIEGLFMYLGLIASTFLMLNSIRKRPLLGDDLYYRAFAIQVGLVATLTASTFSDRFYGESFYWMCALAVALYRMLDDVPAEAAVTVAQPSSLGGGFLAAAFPVRAPAAGR